MRRFLRHTKEVSAYREALVVGLIVTLLAVALTVFACVDGCRDAADARAELALLQEQGAAQTTVHRARAELARIEMQTGRVTAGGIVLSVLAALPALWGGVRLGLALRNADDYTLYVGRLTDPQAGVTGRDSYSFTAVFRDGDGQTLSRPVRSFSLGRRMRKDEAVREVRRWTTHRVLLAYDAARERLLLFGFADDFPAAAGKAEQ